MKVHNHCYDFKQNNQNSASPETNTFFFVTVPGETLTVDLCSDRASPVTTGRWGGRGSNPRVHSVVGLHEKGTPKHGWTKRGGLVYILTMSAVARRRVILVRKSGSQAGRTTTTTTAAAAAAAAADGMSVLGRCDSLIVQRRRPSGGRIVRRPCSRCKCNVVVHFCVVRKSISLLRRDFFFLFFTPFDKNSSKPILTRTAVAPSPRRSCRRCVNSSGKRDQPVGSSRLDNLDTRIQNQVHTHT